MDVASTFAVSVAPPPFQKEVDEARRDTQNRVSIPQLNESHASKGQTHIGDRRGNTEGENSLLVAQQHGMLDAEDEIYVDENGQRKRRRGRRREQEAEEQGQDDASEQGDNYGFGANEYVQDLEGAPNSDETTEPIKAGYDPITGFYLIPATRFHHARKVLLRFREQNVHFLERFSDKTTAVGLINFALCRHYGSIIPHCRLGQVVERRA